MLRYLPIFVIALGLVLVSTSLAGAQTGLATSDDAICHEMEGGEQAESVGNGHAKSGRCWKSVGAGIVIPGCKVFAQTCAALAADFSADGSGWPPVVEPLVRPGLPPTLDLPPPKA